MSNTPPTTEYLFAALLLTLDEYALLKSKANLQAFERGQPIPSDPVGPGFALVAPFYRAASAPTPANFVNPF